MSKIKVVVLLVRQLRHGFTKKAKVSPNLTVAQIGSTTEISSFIHIVYYHTYFSLATTPRYTVMLMVPSLYITDPRYLKRSTLFSASPIRFICNGCSLVETCSAFALLGGYLLTRLRCLIDKPHYSSLWLWRGIIIMADTAVV